MALLDHTLKHLKIMVSPIVLEEAWRTWQQNRTRSNRQHPSLCAGKAHHQANELDLSGGIAIVPNENIGTVADRMD